MTLDLLSVQLSLIQGDCGDHLSIKDVACCLAVIHREVLTGYLDDLTA